MLEDVEQAIAAAEAEAEGKREPAGTPVRRKRQDHRGALPKHLPREEVVADLCRQVLPLLQQASGQAFLGEDVSWNGLDKDPGALQGHRHAPGPNTHAANATARWRRLRRPNI